MWKREPKIIHFAGLPEDTETDLLSFRKGKKCKGPQWFLRRFETAKRCPSVWVQNATSTRCLLCQKMMSSPVTASAISGSWCMEHTHIISREIPHLRMFSPTWGTEEMLQWQQKSGQVTCGILEWQESSSDSNLFLMDIWSEQSNLLLTWLLLTVVTEKKQCRKVGCQQKGRRNRRKKSDQAKVLCTWLRWEAISL